VGEHQAFLDDAIDIRGPESHQAESVGADVGPPDIVTENHQNVRLRGGLLGRGLTGNDRGQARGTERHRE